MNAIGAEAPPTVSPYEYDYFIIYASEDKDLARAIHDTLRNSHRVFWDGTSLAAGQQWDQALSDGLEKSRDFLVVVTGHTKDAYFARFEIQRALTWAADSKGGRSVIPL